MQRITKKFDAQDKTVGRLASQIALALRGKDQPDWSPHIDSGAIVIVNNIKGLKFTGNKLSQKKYFSYSGYPGGLKTKKMSDLFAKNPAEILKRAVFEMLPDNKLRSKQIKRLIIK